MGLSDSMEKFLDPESHPGEKKNYHGSPDFITCLKRKIIWTIHLHCFMTLGSSRSFSGGVTWHSSLRNRLSDWSSIAFGESSKAPKVTNWAHVFCSVWKVYSWKWTGTVHPVFFFMCGFSLILFIHLSPLFSSYICIFTGIQDWKIPKSLSFTFFPLLAGATWRMSSPSFTYPPYFGPAWLT